MSQLPFRGVVEQLNLESYALKGSPDPDFGHAIRAGNGDLALPFEHTGYPLNAYPTKTKTAGFAHLRLPRLGCDDVRQEEMRRQRKKSYDPAWESASQDTSLQTVPTIIAVLEREVKPEKLLIRFIFARNLARVWLNQEVTSSNLEFPGAPHQL
jgi:hypothetical protein